MYRRCLSDAPWSFWRRERLACESGPEQLPNASDCGEAGKRALGVSAVITLLALAVFGFVKGHFTCVPKLKAALQTALVGSLTAAVAYLIAKFIA
jgi:hypothetical protein